LQRRFPKARIGQSPVPGIEVRAFLDRTGQEPAPEWAIRDESGTELNFHNRSIIHSIASKAVAVLLGADLVSACADLLIA
jgi:hypothetical protein